MLLDFVLVLKFNIIICLSNLLYHHFSCTQSHWLLESIQGWVASHHRPLTNGPHWTHDLLSARH